MRDAQGFAPLTVQQLQLEERPGAHRTRIAPVLLTATILAALACFVVPRGWEASSLFAIETAVQKADQDHSKLRMAGIKALREARDILRPEQYSNWRQAHAARQLAQGAPRQERGEQYDGESGDAGRIAPH